MKSTEVVLAKINRLYADIDMKTHSAFRSFLWVLGLYIVLCTPAWAAPTFSDDFNRANGPVGNGWTTALDNVGSDLVIANGRLTKLDTGRGSIYRAFDASQGATVSATYTQMTAEGGALKRYEHYLNVGSTGTVYYSGYGIVIGRSDERYNNSAVDLNLNGVTVGHLPSTFQYGASINVSVTFAPGGNVHGTITGDGNTFAFDFGPRTVNLAALPGSNVLINLEGADTRYANTTYPTLDNLSIISTSVDSLPIATLSTSALEFGIIATGATKDLSFSISNSGGGTLTGVVTAASPFSVIAGGSFSIVAGTSSAVTVRLDPATDGIFSRNLTVAGLPFHLSGTSVTVPNKTPVITKAPADTPQGGKATVLGRNFGLATAPTVTVGGLPATVVPPFDPIHVDFIVPQTGGGTASVVVCTSTCSQGVNMLVLGAAPVITTNTNVIHTTSGSLLIIDGQNFGAGPSVDTHSLAVIDSTAANLVSWSNQRIVMRVPPLPKGVHTLRIGTQFGLTTAQIRYANVTAVLDSVLCDGIVSLALACPPIAVTITNGANGLVDIKVKNESGRWYALSIHASGGAVAPGAMLDSGLVLPVATSLPIGPKGVYNFVGVLLPQVGSVTFTADATAEYAVAASAFDYMAGTICPLLGAGRCPPRLPSDLSGATSFLNDLVAKLVPIKLVGALQKIALSLGLVVDGSPSPSGFIAAVGDLAQEIQTSPEVVAYLTSKGFGITELNSFSEFAKYVTLPWKIIVTFWDIGRSLLAPTVSVITVVGR